METCTVHLSAHGVVIRLVRVLDVDQGPTAEVDSKWQAMPEQHRENSRYAEDEREGDEVPLLTEKVDIRITKKFHAKPQVSMFQSFDVKNTAHLTIVET